MEEWKEYRLGDICDTISDTYKGNSPQVVLINTSDVLEGKCLNHTPVPNKNLKGQFKKTFCNKDILYSEIRPANKRFAYIDFEPKDYIASTKLMVIRSKEEVLPKYLYYILQSNQMLDKLQTLAETRSGTFPQITFSELAAQKIILPGLNSQKKIVQVLESINSKIELNRRINENLEQQAQALFKSWFVDFEPFKDGKFVDSELGMIPEGWRVGVLADIANITMGQSPKGTSYNEIGDGISFYQGRAEFGNRFPSVRLFTTEPSRYAEPYSVLLSVRAPVGDINIAVERCCIGRGLASILSKNKHQSFVLYTMFFLKKELDKFNSEGTVFGSINRSSLENLKIIIPPVDIIDKFENLTSKIDVMLLNLFQETTSLAQLRDTLLPRLMSGELEIKDNSYD